MAELYLFRCEKCGWEVESPYEGSGFLMDGLLAFFVCHDCKHVFEKNYALETEFEGVETCPNCSGKNTETWEPKDGCPKCGGKMKKQGISCLMD